MFINHETNNKINRATTNRPLRVSLHVLVAFAICRLLSVVVIGPAPIALCDHAFKIIHSHVNCKPVGVATKGATPDTTRAIVKNIFRLHDRTL